MTVKEAYQYGVYFLGANGIDEAEFKSKCLVCSLIGKKNSEYKLYENENVIQKQFADLLWRVKSGEPLQYVIGKWDFYESEFYVGDGVLIPRPETEELTELAIKKCGSIKMPVVYDLCAGSGCIGISIAKKITNSQVYLIEKSEKAFPYLLKNAENVDNVHSFCSDIFSFDEKIPQADIIVSNPPYIKTNDISTLQSEVLKEPYMALDGGKDGLNFYRAINDKWTDRLKSNGILLLEIGEDQAQDVESILKTNYTTETFKDLYGNNRIVMAIKS